MAQSMDNNNDVTEVFSRFLAHMLAKNCHTFETCVEVSEGVKNKYEAAELALELGVWVFQQILKLDC